MTKELVNKANEIINNYPNPLYLEDKDIEQCVEHMINSYAWHIYLPLNPNSSKYYRQLLNDDYPNIREAVTEQFKLRKLNQIL